jgi:hypothetical protein
MIFTMSGVFIGVNGTSTDMEMLFWRQVVVGRPSHVVGRPGGAASTDPGFFSSCGCVATKARAELSQSLAGQPRSWAGWSALGTTRPGV